MLGSAGRPDQQTMWRTRPIPLDCARSVPSWCAAAPAERPYPGILTPVHLVALPFPGETFATVASADAIRHGSCRGDDGAAETFPPLFGRTYLLVGRLGRRCSSAPIVSAGRGAERQTGRPVRPARPARPGEDVRKCPAMERWLCNPRPTGPHRIPHIRSRIRSFPAENLQKGGCGGACSLSSRIRGLALPPRCSRDHGTATTGPLGMDVSHFLPLRPRASLADEQPEPGAVGSDVDRHLNPFRGRT